MDVAFDDTTGAPDGADAPIQPPDLDGLIKDLISKKVQIVAVAERLGPFLTSEDIEKRINGVRMFNKVLTAIPEDFLIDTELGFIATFYADRCKDNHKVVPAVLEGVLSIANMNNLNDEVCKTILKAIFDNVPCQQQVRTDRFNIYNIFHVFILKHSTAVKNMGADFNLGFIFSMDGERDPRNLLYLFSILPNFIKFTTFGHVAEEMFEVMACYFPVDFNNQQQDANGITREDLSEKLAVCLSASREFADFCIPLIVEKLDSSLKVAKMDSLKLLTLCYSTFPCGSFLPHMNFVWQSLLKEMVQENNELQNEAHDCFGKLIQLFASDANMSNSCVAFLKQITSTVHPHLIESKTRLKYELYLKILVTMCRASELSCKYTVENANPFLVSQFSLISDDGIKTAIVNYFILAFEACKRFNIVAACLEYFKFMFELIQTAVKSTHSDLRISGFKCVSSMPELMSSEECVLLLDIMQHNIDHERVQIIAEASNMSLLSIAKHNPVMFNSHIDKLFKTVLSINDHFLLRRRVEELCSLISVREYQDVIVDHIIYRITNDDNNVSLEVLKIFIEVVQNKNMFTDVILRDFQIKYGLIQKFLNLLKGKFTESDGKGLEFITTFIVIITRALNSEEQLKLYSDLISEYRIQLEHQSRSAIFILEALLNSSREDVYSSDIDGILEYAIKYALNFPCDSVREKASKLVANILNKYMERDNVRSFYESLKNSLNDSVKNENVIMFMSWLTKSLLLNMHPDSSFWFLQLVDTLNDEKLGLYAAHQFKLIMMESKDALNSDCFSKVNLLYRQKVFHIFTQNLFKIDEENRREAHYLALAYIIQYIPRSVLIMELSKLLPILLNCLKFNDSDLLSAIVNILIFLIQNNKFTIESQYVLMRCLELSGKDNPINVRIASLQCLYNIAHYCSTVQLLHYKQDVIFELAKRLDDPKRVVRSEAVKARTRWYLVGSPGENKDK